MTILLEIAKDIAELTKHIPAKNLTATLAHEDCLCADPKHHIWLNRDNPDSVVRILNVIAPPKSVEDPHRHELPSILYVDGPCLIVNRFYKDKIVINEDRRQAEVGVFYIPSEPSHAVENLDTKLFHAYRFEIKKDLTQYPEIVEKLVALIRSKMPALDVYRKSMTKEHSEHMEHGALSTTATTAIATSFVATTTLIMPTTAAATPVPSATPMLLSSAAKEASGSDASISMFPVATEVPATVTTSSSPTVFLALQH